MKKYAALSIALAALIVVLACISNTQPRPELEFDPLELPAAQAGVAYEATITVSRNATPVYKIFIAEGALPDGLSLEHVAGSDFAKIVGAPTRSGTFKFTLSVGCYATSVSGQTGQKEYAIDVK
jgi:hypothetical protein